MGAEIWEETMFTRFRRLAPILLFGGAVALAPAAARAAGNYPGDCDANWVISIGEVQRAINMFLETEAPGCGVDVNADGRVTIGEVQRVINCFLEDCPSPVIVGLDTNGDGVAEIVDADGNGTLDAAFPADCAATAPYGIQLVALYAGPNPVFAANGLPEGMTLSPGGQITYLPPCSQEGSTQSPAFYLEGLAHWTRVPFLVTRSIHPAIAGLDTNGDGVPEIVDADGNGVLDVAVETDCNHPVPYAYRLVAKDAGTPPLFSATSLPAGMEMAADGSITFSPPCEAAGTTFQPSFSVDSGEPTGIRFLVARRPWLEVDLDNDGISDARDVEGLGSFNCDLAIPCGGAGPILFTLLAHDAGPDPVFAASGLEPWISLVNGNQIQMTPPCDGVEGLTFHPTFTVQGPDRSSSPPETLNVPIYREKYDFAAAEPWYTCPSESPPQETTQVVALDRVWHYFGPEDRRTIIVETDFPMEGSWSQVGLFLNVECPESGKCDIWDRLATLRLILNPEDPPEQWAFAEVARYVTAYDTPMCEYVDLTPIASLLKGHRMLQSFIDTWVGPGNSSGEGWRVTAKFVFYPGPSRAPDQIVGIYDFHNITVGQSDPAQTVDAQTPPVSVEIPAGAWRVEAQLITTGHSFNNTKNCAEFCQMRQDLTVNGTLNSAFPWRPDCNRNPVSPQPGTWKYPRNGWCPGSIVVGEILDITDQVVRGGTSTLDFDIRLSDGTVYNNTNPDSWLPFESVTLRLLIYR
jgi:hypothetical protein